MCPKTGRLSSFSLGLWLFLAASRASASLEASERESEAEPATSRPPPGEARPEPAPGAGVQVELSAGSAVPLYVGGGLLLEGPARLRAELELGWMPKPYAYAIDAALTALRVYPEEVSTLIRAALDSSLVARSSLGWRPLPRLGLEVAAGYTYVTLGGGLAPREVIEVATDRELPEESRRTIGLHSTLHNLHLRVGWRFALAERWALRASIEYLHCFASSSGVDYDARRPAGERLAREVDSALDRYLDGYYTGYIDVPLVGLALAYRL